MSDYSSEGEAEETIKCTKCGGRDIDVGGLCFECHYCTNCDSANLDKRGNCKGCGYYLCPACNTKLDKKYCPKCKKNVKKKQYIFRDG